jgi:hypothetical protein
LSETASRDRYGLALLLLIGSVLVFAIVDRSAFGLVLLLATQGLTVLVVFQASRLPRRVQRGSAVVIALAVVAGIAGVVAGGDRWMWAPAAVGAMLVLAAPVAIVRRLRHHRRIDFSTVLGALCLYVLGGLAFAYTYLLIGDVGGDPFFQQVTRARPVDYVYFSFVTLATLGYGDLTPAGDTGRMIAVTETVLGQLYLVGAVAAIVSNLGRVRKK